MYQVLIVDDEPIIKIALRSLISWEQHGFQICGTASNGQEALELTKKYQPDIIITDLIMPVMNGIEFIERLKKQDFQGEILVISNHEDFEYVRSALVMGAVDYLLKMSLNEDALLEQLKKVEQKLQKEQSLEKMQLSLGQQRDALDKKHQMIILRDYLMNEDFQETAASLKNDKGWDRSYLMCYISFRSEQRSNPLPVSQNLLESLVIEKLPGLQEYEVVFPNSESLLLLLSVQELEEKDIKWKEWLFHLPAHIRLCISLTPIVIYHSGVKGYPECRKIFRQMEDILSILTFYEKNTIIDAEERTPVHYLPVMYYKDLAARIIDLGVKGLTGDIELIESLIRQCRQSFVYPEIIKLYFVKTIELLEFMADSLSILTHDFLTETRENIRFCLTQSDLMKLIKVSLQAIYQPEAENKPRLNYKNEVNEALQYISDNYGKKISLASVAEHVNLSSSYLCRIFKVEVGISITNYINSLRMEKAKEMLRQGDNSIKEIALNVGIDDQLYFSRMFKKHFDVSPSDYKQSLAR